MFASAGYKYSRSGQRHLALKVYCLVSAAAPSHSSPPRWWLHPVGVVRPTLCTLAALGLACSLFLKQIRTPHKHILPASFLGLRFPGTRHAGPAELASHTWAGGFALALSRSQQRDFSSALRTALSFLAILPGAEKAGAGPCGG